MCSSDALPKKKIEKKMPTEIRNLKTMAWHGVRVTGYTISLQNLNTSSIDTQFYTNMHLANVSYDIIHIVHQTFVVISMNEMDRFSLTSKSKIFSMTSIKLTEHYLTSQKFINQLDILTTAVQAIKFCKFH